MSAELIVQDFGGLNNADLGKSGARIIKGGSWKRQRVVTIIPAASMIPAKCALAMMGLIYPPNNGVVRILAQGLEVGHAYSSAIEQVLAHPDLSTWEWILCMEQDNAPPPDGLLKLITRMEAHPELSAISGLYWTKGGDSTGPFSPCGVPQIWGNPQDPLGMNFMPQPPRLGELVECCGIGQGFGLFRLSMFKDTRLRRPWFVTQQGPQGVSTQDLYFWSDARKYGFRCAVDCDCKVGHWDGTIMW